MSCYIHVIICDSLFHTNSVILKPNVKPARSFAKQWQPKSSWIAWNWKSSKSSLKWAPRILGSFSSNVAQMFIKDILRIPCLYNHQITKWRPGVAMLHHRNLSPSLLTDANVRTSLWSFRFLQQEDTSASDFYFKSTKESLFLQKAEYSCKHPHLVLKHCANTTNCLLFFLGTWWEYLMWGGCRAFRKQPD